MLIADIDHFKRVNDEHGHAAGDAALRTLAATLMGGVRAGDLAARWGGEEFAVLVQDADEAALSGLAERLRVLVARSSVRLDMVELTVRISIGGSLATASDSPSSILARADEALYEAKAAGRDRVVVRLPTAAAAARQGGS